MLMTKRLECFSLSKLMLSCQSGSTCPDLEAHPPSCRSAASVLSPAQSPAHQKRDPPLHDTHANLKLLLTAASDQAAVVLPHLSKVIHFTTPQLDFSVGYDR